MDRPIFKWLLIFKDGTHLTGEGDGSEEACESVGRVGKDLALSKGGFLKALPLKRIDNVKVMDEQTKKMLKALGKQKRELRNNGKKKKNRPQTQARHAPQTPKIKRSTALDKILE